MRVGAPIDAAIAFALDGLMITRLINLFAGHLALLRSELGAIARGKNPLRWIEYSISSTIMILAVASLSR